MTKYLKHCWGAFSKSIETWITRIDRESKNVIWNYTNIYPTARIGVGNSIGSYSEIGDGVEIGDDCRIGAYCFLPYGVIISDGCFIGPRVTFTNDKYPPSGKEEWKHTMVEENAAIGAGCVILPGITIGKNAMIGAGSVVTKDVPDGETWYGNPARKVK